MGYIISFGYSQSAIWFYNLRAPQICFRNFWDQKIDQVETQDRCVAMCFAHKHHPKNSPKSRKPPSSLAVSIHSALFFSQKLII